MPSKTPPKRLKAETREKRRSQPTVEVPISPSDFPHGLVELCAEEGAINRFN
jgi:hypothetical protein